jgi:hypothetical protein
MGSGRRSEPAWRACHNQRVIWLGEKRGYLTDWVTQQWVRATGRRILLSEFAWLDGPCGETHRIGTEFFESYARTKNLEVVRGGVRGLIREFVGLEAGNHQLNTVSQKVKEFYERTSEFDLDSWSEWSGLFKPFGRALSVLFSTRLQQLNVPLSPMDSARGMTSDVIQMKQAATGQVVCTAWVRELRATGKVLYAGSYSLCRIPGNPNPCVRVVFPLPNGNAIVIMKAVSNGDGALSLQSMGQRFGDPGFYFTVHDGFGMAWARYVRSMQEEIRVYSEEPGTVRADHILWLWGLRFLRLHYRMQKRPA